MTDRFYTAENVLDLVCLVFNVHTLVHKDKTEFISSVCFPGKEKGTSFTMANGGSGKDYYDGLYCLLWQIATFKDEGKMPDGVMKLREGEGHPMDIAVDLLQEKRLGESNG